jgi:hypothetical protein
MALRNSGSLDRPAKDEWGVYDPQQAGLAALFARLDARDKNLNTPQSPAAKEVADAPARPGFRNE